ncbi:Rib/alpha-like domain-containing protein [Corynebacterium phoceense]|uniref:Rib/alpha-like domain-containing protein n=1 Tax=Corynebacterium phoceense TaxID=1686286 RepID=UPI001D4CCD56|nr:Rib/alpha-like domain-containing protein [Corynebacterium phoceense]HJG43319.1 YPDG domain-containing protein [Corynebacterium phoceense]
MISKKMLSLLTAVAMGSGIVATAAVAAPSVVASEQTMADQYEPRYVETTQRAETSFRVPLTSDEPLPQGTTFTLLGINVAGYMKIEDGLIVHLWGTSGLWVQISGSVAGVTPEGRTTSAEILVTYPDGSSEIVETEVTFIPQDEMVYSPTYPPIEVVAGASQDVDVESDKPLPEGVRFQLTNSTAINNFIAEGWEIAVQPSGMISIKAPAGAPENSFRILVVAMYADGTSDLVEIPVTVTEPQPIHNETYEVTYGDADVTGGEAVTVSPTETDLPAGTRITLADNTALSAAGWTLEVTAGGELTATAPNDADGTVEIALTVTYPDGTTEPTTAEVTATPAPKDEKDGEDDQPVAPNRPQAGGSSLGSS